MFSETTTDFRPPLRMTIVGEQALTTTTITFAIPALHTGKCIPVWIIHVESRNK